MLDMASNSILKASCTVSGTSVAGKEMVTGTLKILWPWLQKCKKNIYYIYIIVCQIFLTLKKRQYLFNLIHCKHPAHSSGRRRHIDLTIREKTKAIGINFTDNYQFQPRLTLNNQNIEVVDKSKFFGTIIENNLSRNENCMDIIWKVNARKQLLRKVWTFG